MKQSMFIRIVGLMLCLVMPLGAMAQQANSINSIDVSTLQGGDLLVKVNLKQELAALPSSFAINNPARLAFDFHGVNNALGKNLVEVDKGDLRSINVVQAGDRTRVVMNLLRPVTFESKIEGQNLLITVHPTVAAPMAGTSTTTQFVAPKVGDAMHNIRDVGFHRGKNGEAKIEIDLSDANTGIDIRQQGPNIVVDFIKTKLPHFLERRLDVIDFGTPVNLIDTFTQGDNVRMVIEPKGQWEQSAYQTDNKFILEVRPLVQDPNKLVQGSKPGYSGEKLSLDFRNTDIRSLLFAIADFTGLNIVISDSVSGNLTLRLKDVPWDQALDIILQHKGLGMRKNGNVIMIAPSDEIAAREKLDLEGRQKISELEELRTESIQLNYQKAADVQRMLVGVAPLGTVAPTTGTPGSPTSSVTKILSSRGSVVVDPVTNTLFVQDTTSKLEEIRKLILQIDIPVKQVMIEARIVEANDNFSRNLGVRLGYNSTQVPTTSGVLIGNSGGQTIAGAAVQNPNVNLPVLNPAGVFSLMLFNRNATNFINLELSASEQDQITKTISSPRVVTANNVKALISDGNQIFYPIVVSTGATTTPSYQPISANLSLEVTPQIVPNDNVIMKLHVTNDSLGVAPTTGGPPPISTKTIDTNVMVENGGTVVIGGVHVQSQGNTENKVPMLGDIPVLGNLFKSTAKINNKRELLIFVTPKVLKESLNIR